MPGEEGPSVRPFINWYPGHIAKAERQMKEVLKAVDVVVEVRDARIPRSTSHPLVTEWVGKKKRLVVLNRLDCVPQTVAKEWQLHLQRQDETVFFANCQLGEGIHQVKKAILSSGKFANDRRERRGILPRAIRVAVLGYPNVGKSALINRLTKRSIAKSENKAGVTRQFKWVRIDKDLELLDSPGIIPARQVNQDCAYKLAMCDDISNAAYDTQCVAASLVDQILTSQQQRPSLLPHCVFNQRYGVPASEGVVYLESLAVERFTGNIDRAANAVLKDFRSGKLGKIPLEFPDQEGPS